MKNISLVRYSPYYNNHALTAQLVECYREVFADSPWHEWLKCPRCHKYWGKKDQDFLAANKFHHCNTPLVDFWPREQVIYDLYHEISSKTSCWLAMQNDSVVGFCWGYPIILSDLEDKLNISLSTQPELKGVKRLAYQDEVGVLSAYRGQKIAKKMIAQRLQDFLAQGLKVGIVRTRQSPEPSTTFLWYTGKLGYKIIANYPEPDGRVILGREFNGLKELLNS